MYLQNNFKVIESYTGSSKFQFWHDLKPGDIISIKMELKDPGRGRGLYATRLIVESSSDNFIDSVTGILSYLKKMKVEQV